jgi:hypothetical protein
MPGGGYGGVHLGRQPQAQHAGDHERDRRQQKAEPVRAAQLDDKPVQTTAGEHGGQAEQGQTGVGRHQRHPGGDQPWRGGGPDHAVGLGQHERAQRQREQRVQVVEVLGHQDGQRARPNALVAIATRRPCWKRSSTGPITGATGANVAMVIYR